MTPRPWFADPDEREIMACLGIAFVAGCLVGFIIGILVSLIP